MRDMIARLLLCLRFVSIAMGAVLFGHNAAMAAGQPRPWGIGLQESASPVMDQVHDFHTLLMVLMSLVVVVVMGLLAYVIVRFRKKANPNPAKFSHNTLVEVIWTVIPVLILLIIAVPSFQIIYYMDRTTEPDLTLKAIGYQWYWGYEYPDLEIGEFAAYMVPDGEEDATRGDVRLLSTDNKVVVPVEKNVQLLVTAGDVLHSFAVPSLGVKKDAVPGRLNEAWFRIHEPGVYFGQCSEICGINHAFMPIEIHAVSEPQFEQWVALAKDDLEAANSFVIDLNLERHELELAAAPPKAN